MANKWQAISIVKNFKPSEFVNKTTGAVLRKAQWTMMNQTGKSTSFYNCETWNHRIIDALKEGMEIELLDYSIKVNSYTDKNMLKRSFTYLDVRQIEILNDGVSDQDAVIIRKNREHEYNQKVMNKSNNEIDDLEKQYKQSVEELCNDFEKEIEEEEVKIDWKNDSNAPISSETKEVVEKPFEEEIHTLLCKYCGKEFTSNNEMRDKCNECTYLNNNTLLEEQVENKEEGVLQSFKETANGYISSIDEEIQKAIEKARELDVSNLINKVDKEEVSEEINVEEATFSIDDLYGKD